MPFTSVQNIKAISIYIHLFHPSLLKVLHYGAKNDVESDLMLKP